MSIARDSVYDGNKLWKARTDVRMCVEARRLKSEGRDDLSYEHMAALECGAIQWGLIPVYFIEKWGLSDRRDRGIDAVVFHGDDKLSALQMKHYQVARLYYQNIATFVAYAQAIRADRTVLVTLPETRLDKSAQMLLDKGVIDEHKVVCARSAASRLDAFEKDARDRLARLKPYKPRINQTKGLQIFWDCFLAGQKDVRQQHPCGTGKTYLSAAAIKKVRAHRAGAGARARVVIFVPTIYLMHQTYETMMDLGISCGRVGGGYGEGRKYPIVVCVYNSVSHLPRGGPELDLVIIDEAHHLALDSTDAVAYRKQILGMATQCRLRLSATMPRSPALDYEYSMDDAVDNGHVADILIHNVEFSAVDACRVEAFAGLIATRDWGPTAVYFNSVKGRNTGSNMKQLKVALAERGIKADIFVGDTPAAERRRIIASFEASGDDASRVLLLCGCLNEGASIACLETVVFFDLRGSEVNMIQVALRCNRLHPAKPCGRIVLPTFTSDATNARFACMLRGLSKISHRIGKSILGQGGGGRMSHETVDAHGIRIALCDALVRSETTIDRFGAIVYGPPLKKSRALVAFIEEHGQLPSTKGKKDEKLLAVFWNNIKGPQKSHKSLYATILSKYKILKESYEQTQIKKTPDEKSRALVAFIEEHGRLPSKGKKDEKLLAKFWNRIKGPQKCHKSLYATVLSKYKMLKESYEQAQIKQTPAKKSRALVAFIEEHGRLPSTQGKKDEKLLARFWNNIKGPQKCHKSLYATVLSKYKILKESYEKNAEKI